MEELANEQPNGRNYESVWQNCNVDNQKTRQCGVHAVNSSIDSVLYNIWLQLKSSLHYICKPLFAILANRRTSASKNKIVTIH